MDSQLTFENNDDFNIILIKPETIRFKKCKIYKDA